MPPPPRPSRSRQRRRAPAAAGAGAWLLALLLASASPTADSKKRQACAAPGPGQPQLYGFKVVAEFPHDPSSFTQGLVFSARCYDDASGDCVEVLYESTGMYGASEVRATRLDTGRVEAATKMGDEWFGEGLAMLGDRLFQVTWKGPKGFVYSARDLKQTGTFSTPLRDGWGAAADGGLLVLSDGGSRLTWVDPEDGFKEVRSVEVTADGRPVPLLNEVRAGGGRRGGACVCVEGGSVWVEKNETNHLESSPPQTKHAHTLATP